MNTSPQRAVLGYLLFVLHARCRFSDALLADGEAMLDESEGAGFVEVSTRVTQTSQLRSGHRLQIPLVAFSDGVLGLPWAR
eukprot:2003546-Amphidinium_carterae.1